MLPDIIRDWLPTAGWEMLEVKHNTICPKFGAPVSPLGTTNIGIQDDRVGNILAADPQFFEKLDQFLITKYFSGAAWYQQKTYPNKPRKRIWPK